MKRKLKMFSLSKRKALFLGVLVFAWINLSNAQNNGYNLFVDQDQDGLTDQEENAYGTDPQNADTDGDGYSDGKEVQSGYNPLKPAPGDRLIPEITEEEVASVEAAALLDDGVNLTDTFIQNMQQLKGEELEVLQKISTDPNAIGDEALQQQLQSISLTQGELTDILQTSFNQADDNDEVVMLDESEIKVMDRPEGDTEEEIKAAEKKQIEEYFVAVGYVFLQNAPFEVQNENDLKEKSVSFVSEFSNILAEGNLSKVLEFKNNADTSFQAMKALEVPYVLKDIHLTGLSILNYVLQQNPADLVNQGDPMSLVMMVGKLESAAEKMQTLGLDVDKIFQEYGITGFKASEQIQTKVETELSTDAEESEGDAEQASEQDEE